MLRIPASSPCWRNSPPETTTILTASSRMPRSCYRLGSRCFKVAWTTALRPSRERLEYIIFTILAICRFLARGERAQFLHKATIAYPRTCSRTLSTPFARLTSQAAACSPSDDLAIRLPLLPCHSSLMPPSRSRSWSHFSTFCRPLRTFIQGPMRREGDQEAGASISSYSVQSRPPSPNVNSS